VNRNERYLVDHLRFLAERFQILINQQQRAGHLPDDYADPALDTAIAVANHALGEVPQAELLGSFSAIVYFRTEDDRQEFAAAVTLAKPDMAVLNAPRAMKVSRS